MFCTRSNLHQLARQVGREKQNSEVVCWQRWKHTTSGALSGSWGLYRERLVQRSRHDRKNARGAACLVFIVWHCLNTWASCDRARCYRSAIHCVRGIPMTGNVLDLEENVFTNVSWQSLALSDLNIRLPAESCSVPMCHWAARWEGSCSLHRMRNAWGRLHEDVRNYTQRWNRMLTMSWRLERMTWAAFKTWLECF